jgi:hypothetical protein
MFFGPHNVTHATIPAINGALPNLWDSHTDMFANGQFLAGGGGLNYRVRYLSQGDCIVWAVHILGVW